MTSLRTLIDKASEMAEARFDPTEPMMPQFLVVKADGGLTLYALAMGGRDLDAVRRDLELRFRLERCLRWVFVAEAWLVEYSAGGNAELAPVDHPERIEVIQFDAYEAASGKRRRGSRQILRVADGDVRLLPMVVPSVKVVDVPTEAGGARA